MTTVFESVLLNSVSAWFAFFVVNHADITGGFRRCLYPRLPKWVVSLVTCPVCVTFWALAGMCALWGFTPMLFWVPPVTLFIDLSYRRLAGKGGQ